MKEIMVELKRMREWLDWMKPMPPMSAWHTTRARAHSAARLVQTSRPKSSGGRHTGSLPAGELSGVVMDGGAPRG